MEGIVNHKTVIKPMTQLTNQERDALMADMKSFDEQMPCVGFFRYDPVGRFLFDVRKMELTPLEVEAAAEKGIRVIRHPDDRENDSVDFRGCIIWYVDKFIVLVGKWAEPILEELSEMMEKEFSLPYFEFVYDEHRALDHAGVAICRDNREE